MQSLLTKHTHKKPSGYIVLMAIIVIGAIAVTSSLVILTLSSDSTQASAVAEKSNQAKALANACAEYALDALKQNPVYSGNETLTIGAGECDLESINFNGDIATIHAMGISSEVMRKVEVIAQVTTIVTGEPPAEPISTTTVVLQSWQEVANY